MIRKVEMERFTVISVNPFDEVVAAIKASIGNPNMAEFVKSTQEAKSAADLDTAIQPVLGRTGLMLFVEFDQGRSSAKAPSAAPRESFVSSLGILSIREPARAIAGSGICLARRLRACRSSVVFSFII